MICLLDADDYFFSENLNILKKKFLENDFCEVIFDLPLVKNLNSLKKFKLKNKKQKYIWSTIINTSSIVLTRKFLNECIEKGISPPLLTAHQFIIDQAKSEHKTNLGDVNHMLVKFSVLEGELNKVVIEATDPASPDGEKMTDL